LEKNELFVRFGGDKEERLIFREDKEGISEDKGVLQGKK